MTMSRKCIELKTGSWCGDRTVTLTFPAHWSIQTHEGIEQPALSPSQIETQIVHPVENLKLESLLSPDKTVAIVIDDHTRPTPVSEILQPLLRLLNTNGISNQQIKIIVAIGTHILKYVSFMKSKLMDILDSGVEIILPDCRNRRDLVYMGESNTGIPVYVNRHFAHADIKIAVSGVYPHDEAGFSGGAKILIGLLGLETLSRFHREHGLLRRGAAIDTDFRNEIEHFADLAGLDYGISCTINANKSISGVYCGDFRKAFRIAARKAQECFGTGIDADADVVIANAYPLDTSLCVLGKSRWPFNYCKASAYRIILTALCDCSGDRIPLASSRTELNLQRLKRISGITSSKRMLKTMSRLLGILCNPGRKWKEANVIYVTHIDRNQRRRPKIISNCYVEYEWENIISDLLERAGPEDPLNVSIYLCTPLLFPETHSLGTVDRRKNLS